MESRMDGGKIGPLDTALVLAEHWRILLLVTGAAAILAFVLTFAFAPIYTATARIVPPGQQQSPYSLMASQLGSLAGLVTGVAGLKNPADQYVGLLKSRTIQDAVIQRFKLRELYRERYIEDARRELDKRTRISAGIKDGLISIEVEDEDPKRAAEIANAYVDELRKLTNNLAITEAAKRRVFFDSQLKEAKNSLASAERALWSSGVSEATLRATPQSALEGIARLKAQITAQEIRIASMRTFLTDSNPQFKLAQQELAALRAELAKAERDSSVKVSGDGSDYIGRYREFKYQETLFELMAKQYELARLDEAREGAFIQVVDVAEPPEKKTKPRRGLISALVALCGLILSVSYLFGQRTLLAMNSDPAMQEKLRRFRSFLRIRRR